MSNHYTSPGPLRPKSILLTLTLILLATALSAAPTDWPWVLEVDANYTCTATKYNSNHTDTHKGSVTFQMPEETGTVSGKKGGFNYHTTGQTMGRAWNFSTPGEFYFTGEITPGQLRFTPRVRLPDGTDFYTPHLTHTMPVYDGATLETPPASNPDVSCKGYVRYTLRGKPRERYQVTVDDRLLWAKTYGKFSGTDYRVKATLQVLTEIEITVEDDKIKSATGTRRMDRITPGGDPSGVWSISDFTGTCPLKTTKYPYAPQLSNSQIAASVRDTSTISLAVPRGYSGVAVKWKIKPKIAKQVSPAIQVGKPSDFSGEWCADLFLHDTSWIFPRRRNTHKITQDTFDHLQIFTVNQLTTATGLAPGQTSSLPPAAKNFQGDRAP